MQHDILDQNCTAWTGSVWIRDAVSGGDEQKILDAPGSSYGFEWRDGNTDVISVYARRDSDHASAVYLESNPVATGTDWNHILFSFDTTDPARAHLYVNGVNQLNSITMPTAGTVLRFTYAQDRVGDQSTFLPIEGDIAELWSDFCTYIDLSVPSNRRKFIDGGGDPVYLGADGGLPTGSAPDIFLSGDTATWHTNKGTGGGFTENGALTDAVSIPRSIPLMSLPQGCPSFGDVCDDGTVYAGLSPDGNVEMFTTPEDAGNDSWNNGGNGVHFVPTGYTSHITGRANTEGLALLVGNGAPYNAAKYCADLVAHGHDDWYLPARDELIPLFTYRDQIGNFSPNAINYYWSSSEEQTWDAIRIDITTGAFYEFDDKDFNYNFRCVRKGSAPRCQNPSRPIGTMIYNADHNIMQYCDPWAGGNGWQAMGN